MKQKSVFMFFLLVLLILRLVILVSTPNTLSFSESFKATAAYDLITEQRFDLFDYTYRHNEGGSLVTTLLAAIMFRLFGVTVFAFRLVPLLFSIMSFSLGYFIVHRYFGARKAIIFALLFVFAPSAYIQLSITGFGNHAESILFFFLLTYITARICALRDDFSKERKVLFAGFGFVCGFSIWYGYFNMIAVLSSLLVLFMLRHRRFKLNDWVRFFIFFIAGLLLLLIYRFTYAGGGEWIIKSKPLYAHFFTNSFKQVVDKAGTLLAFDLPRSLFFKKSAFLSRDAMAWTYYLTFLCLVFLIKGLKLKQIMLKLRQLSILLVFI